MDTNHKTIQVPATLDGISPLKDGGLSIRFHTQEMSDDMKLIALAYYQKFGWMLFREAEFKDEDVPQEDPTNFEDDKTPAQRLRGVLFIYFTEVLKKPKEEFNDFYRKTVEKYIDAIKAKLP